MIGQWIAAQGFYTTRRAQASESEAFINPCQAPFYHGVASGDPLADRVIIWTRVTRPDMLPDPVTVGWQIASDVGFANILQSGTTTADTATDFTVKLDIQGLQPGTYYYYRFTAFGDTSIIGRTLTAPTGTVSRLRFGVVSCSDYRQGYFQAYGNMARRNDLDAVVHLGDYIYEGGGGPTGRVHDPNSEIYRLQDYRTRYSQYHLDTSLQRCHQVHPFITVWDDHDIVVDALRDTSYRHNAGAHGLYRDRKFAAIRAAREWLPIRDPDSLTQHFYKNWREFHYGDLADIFMLDARLYDRDKFPDDQNDTTYGAANLRIIGPEQMNWITTGLANSTARWKLVGNQVMLSQFVAGGVPLVFENWDGYPAERNQFYDNLQNNSINNVVVLTGDFHCSFANDVPRDALNFGSYNPFNGNGSLCVEYVVPSITGDNYDEGNDFGLGAGNAGAAQGLIQLGNPHTKYVDLTAHGYILLDLNTTRAQAEFWHLADKGDPMNLGESTGGIYKADHNANKVSSAGSASTSKTGVPLSPPFACGLVSTQTPQDLTLLSLFPNPTHDISWLNFALNTPGQVSVVLYDLTGKPMRTVFEGEMQTGNYLMEVDVRELPQGIYLLKIQTPQGRQAVKIWVH